MNSRISLLVILSFLAVSLAGCAADRSLRRSAEKEKVSQQFAWWPSDAQPAPVKDKEHNGYWWWPKTPGQARPWGNRGYCYVDKIIFDYKSDELPSPQPQEMRPSLVIKKIIRNVKVYFDYNKSSLRNDAKEILAKAVISLEKNPQADILISGNCDKRGTESYNEKLGRRRAEAVENFMRDNGIDQARIRIVSHGKLNAVAPISDIVGMQKDRNAQFMVAEVQEVMLPYQGENSAPSEVQASDAAAQQTEEIQEEVTSQPKASTREYRIKKNDSLWKIAAKEMGSGHRWKYLYEMNKSRIKNPNKLKAGTKILIPVE